MLNKSHLQRKLFVFSKSGIKISLIKVQELFKHLVDETLYIFINLKLYNFVFCKTVLMKAFKIV